VVARSPLPDPPPRDLRALKVAICARARDFEIAPLLDLLAGMGYRPADVWFRGHVTVTPQPTLVHHIEFAEIEGVIAGPLPGGSPAVDLGSIADLADAPTSFTSSRAEIALPEPPPRHRPGGPPSQVTITVNLGLLSCRSPLPSYFQHLLRDSTLHEPLVELLRIIDRNLLRARLTSNRPERLVDQWDEITGDLLRIQSLDSLIGLSWLFRRVFPELPVRVERTSEQLRVPYASARLGSSDLGSACFGALTRIDVHDFQVTLTCDESLLRPGVPWLHEADRRLRTIIFPALDPVCMNLTVLLELQDDSAVAILRDAREPRDSYLGLDPLGEPGSDLPVRRVILYSGLLPRDQLDTDELEGALAAQARVTVTAPSRTGRASTSPGDPADTEALSLPGELDSEHDLELVLDLGSRIHRFHATVRWGTRGWFRDEPYAIDLRCGDLPPAPPTPHHHPQLWSLLRDHARRDLAAALATSTLADYGAATVTDAIVADLLARHQDAALHALLAYGDPGDVPPAAWERFLRSTSA
jgi:hypothetical protein